MLGTAALLIAFQTPLTVASLPDRIRGAKSKEEGEALAGEIRRWFGKGIADGSSTKTDGTVAAFAVESEDPPEVRGDNGLFQATLTRIEGTHVWAGEVSLRDGDGTSYTVTTPAKTIGKGFVDVYVAEPETKVDPGVPKGTVTEMPKHTSMIFKGAMRDWWIYTPPGLKDGEEANLMVFQDGAGPKGWAAPVLDNLIAKGELPKTVLVCLNPGTRPDGTSERSFEYDTLSDTYVRFLDEEILPEVEKRVKLSHDPARRAIAGGSSGGICAFTAAWERPQSFGKVLSWIGSFTNIAHGSSNRDGGHSYPFLIRLVEPKPVRVYLEDGRNDLDNSFGNWPLANQSMAAALKFKGYDYRFDYANNNHSDHYVRAHLPSILRWLWRP